MPRRHAILVISVLGCSSAGCGPPDCDYDLEVDALMPADVVDCGPWDGPGDQEPLDCAKAAIADGRDFRFDADWEGHRITALARADRLWWVSSFDDARWIVRAKAGGWGIDVSPCEGSAEEALAALETDGYCRPDGPDCNVCPYDEDCEFDE